MKAVGLQPTASFFSLASKLKCNEVENWYR